MSTSMGSTGITFPDATTQTTAATAATPSIPSGSVLLFYQASAPTGWTQVTSLNDCGLRLVNGVGGTTGGTTAFSTVFTNQTPTITTSGLSVGATTLSTAQIPSHSHPGNNSGGGGSPYYTTYTDYGINNPDVVVKTNPAGGGGSHTHSITGSATSSAVTLNLLYANIILCSKN